MNELITSQQLIGYHRSKEDYLESPVNSLQFGYGDQRYSKMTYELLNESDVLREKILRQAIEDFSLYFPTNSAARTSTWPCSVQTCSRWSCNTSATRMTASDCWLPLSSYLSLNQKKVCAAPLGRQTIIKTDCIQKF